MATSAADILNPASAILGGVVSGVQLFDNLAKEKKDKAELASIRDPFYKVQDEYYQNRNLDANLAGGGTPVAAQDYYTSESQRGLSAGVSGTLQSGGNSNDIARIFDVYNRGIDKTHAESAEQHIKNIQYFKESNKDLAGQKTMQWALNQYQPTQEKRRLLSQNISAEQQNVASGASGIVGSLSALGTGFENSDLLKKLFQNKGVDGQVDAPFNITSEPIGSLPPGYGANPPTEATAGVPNSLNTDDYAAFNNWLKNRKI